MDVVSAGARTHSQVAPVRNVSNMNQMGGARAVADMYVTGSDMDGCGGVQVHAVPMGRPPQLDMHSGEAMRMWKEQVKWVLLWFTLSLLTCMHSAALILALQYNLIAVVSPFTHLASPHLISSPHFASPRLTSDLISPHTSPHLNLTSPHLTSFFRPLPSPSALTRCITPA